MDNFLANLAFPPSDQVQSWGNEPTVRLRWKNGTLEQMTLRRGYNAHGLEIKHREEWWPVPTAD